MKKYRGWKALVFDLDDTLYPERAYVLSGFRSVSRWCSDNLGLDGKASLDALLEISERGERRHTFDRFLESVGFSLEHVPRLVSEFRSHVPEISPYPHALSLLRRLAGEVRLGIVSDGDLKVQEKKLAALDLGQYFDAVVFSDALGKEHWKPSEVPFRAVAEALGVTPRESIYVGENSLKDFVGARRAGMRTIRVLEPAGYYTGEEPPGPEHEADVTIRSLTDFDEALDQLARLGQDRFGEKDE